MAGKSLTLMSDVLKGTSKNFFNKPGGEGVVGPSVDNSDPAQNQTAYKKYWPNVHFSKY